MTPPHRRSPLLTRAHGFFGRQGGVSAGVFASLNASYASGDDEARVTENRRRIAAALPAAALLTARQTHSATALFVTEPFPHDERPEADALVTSVPGLAVGVLAADCVPVLLEADGLVAAIHAGWKGSLAGIIAATVELMTRHGAVPSTIHAAIGPHLRQPSFEVRDDLIALVTARHPDSARHFSPLPSGQSLYDHTAFVRERLVEAGIDPARIGDVGGDTLAEPERFFSYRAACRAGQQRFGHNLSAIAPGDAPLP